MKTSTDKIQDNRNRIDEYLNTVYAIINFLNTYKFEVDKTNDNIILFQGRKLYVEDGDNFVTPDLGLTISDNIGLVREVKYSFSANQEYWKNTFTQLKKYDSILNGWPTSNNLVNSFDIVLLVHQTRSRNVVDYYLKLSDEDKINKTFAIIEFNRSTQGKEYFYFRLESGNLSHSVIREKLYQGLQIPFEIYLSNYSTIKIYDVEPPIPLMLYLIYECIIDKLTGENKYKKLSKKTKIIVEITAHELTNRLRETYSFKSLQSAKFSQGQPEFPKHDWIKKALDKLSDINEGHWIQKADGQFAYFLTQKDGSIIDYYIKKCSEDLIIQGELFKN